MTPGRSRRTVLVIEDAVAVQRMLEDFFTLHGYDVLVAAEPETALRRLKQSHAVLDAMILDIGLGGDCSGLDILELLRLDDRFVDLTVVVLTGLDLGAKEQETIQRNRAHLLHKKDGYEKVFNRLDQIIKPLADRPPAHTRREP
jgi:DNA-binding response OmpR family regulator